jgi:hypothetical protein
MIISDDKIEKTICMTTIRQEFQMHVSYLFILFFLSLHVMRINVLRKQFIQLNPFVCQFNYVSLNTFSA